MDPNQDTENSDYTFDLAEDEPVDESGSVDDFIRELEAKEKDLHITAETTFIEIAADFDDADEVPDFIHQHLPEAGKMSVKPLASASDTDDAAVKRLETEVASLKARIAGLEEERTELYENSKRRLKDFDAYKARTERERGETFQRQLSNLATQMLPALDNLDRALQFAADMGDERQTEFVQFFDGIVLVNQQMNEVLVEMGIVPIPTVGYPFDPHIHEAVAIDETSEMPPNTVTAELLRGFCIDEKVIRHAMVRVSKAAEEAKRSETEMEAEDGSGETAHEHASDEEGVEPHAFGEGGASGVETTGCDQAESGLAIERNGEISDKVD